MNKRILLIGYNYFPEPTGIGKYSGEMIDWLAEKGYHCTVITTYPYYPYWKIQEPYRRNRFWFKTEKYNYPSGGSMKIIRCPMYVPKKPSGIKRMMLDFSFSLSAGMAVFKEVFSRKYAAVMAIAPSFQFGLLGVVYKKTRNTKFIYHIHDMQIEAARDLKMIKSKKVLRLLFRIERYIFSKADVISSVSEGMICKIGKKAGKKIHFFPNWTNTKTFFPLENTSDLKIEYGFGSADKIILYSGAIGEKQGLEAIIHAAGYFKERTEIKFLICGSGPYKQRLQELTEELGLGNVFFLPLQPIEKFNSFLNLADVHLVIQKADASDLMMPSKLTTILSVGGLALITANKGSGLHYIVEKHRMGIVVDAEDQQALNKGIELALNNNSTAIRTEARKYAERYLSFENIMRSFETEILCFDSLRNPSTAAPGPPLKDHASTTLSNRRSSPSS